MAAQSYNRNSVINIDRRPLLLCNPLSTLSTTFIPVEKICKIFSIKNKDFPLPRFVELNRKAFEFLDIRAEIVYQPERKGIELHTSRYAGAVPIKSPKTSLYAVDLCVRGSYSPKMSDDELYQLLSIMGQELLPEFSPDLKLVGTSVKPPIYFECENFIYAYQKAINANWTKFVKEVKVESMPRGATNWNKYALESYDPQKVLSFENHINGQSQIHPEWCKLNYVFSIASKTLASRIVPKSIQNRCLPLVHKLETNPITQPTLTAKSISIQANDPIEVKNAKRIANMILTDTSSQKRSWRIDIARLYEIYVQYIFTKALPHWHVAKNPHYSISGDYRPWGLKYLEPDIILHKGQEQIVVDAKYKSNMLVSGKAETPLMKESFRHDLHQVLAYSAFNSMEEKEIMLVYPIAPPSDDDETSEETTEIVRVFEQNIRTPFSSNKEKILLIGIPFNSKTLKQTILEIRALLREPTAD